MKLIAIDMDGTLLRGDKSFDLDRFERAVHALKEAGTRVCIASGNSYPKLRGYFDDQLRQELLFASTNGNAIMVEEQGLHYSALDYDTTEAIIDFLNESTPPSAPTRPRPARSPSRAIRRPAPRMPIR